MTAAASSMRAGRRLETAEEKLAFLAQSRLANLASEEIRPDAKANWLNLTHNDFGELLPVIDKGVKVFDESPASEPSSNSSAMASTLHATTGSPISMPGS
ncbi:MAG: hypothetical protein U1E95_01790 [Rubrivivax sp.]